MAHLVEILDGIMGSSKTTNTCKWMEENNHKYKFFYISPLLDEVKDGGRIQQACPTTRFVSPQTSSENINMQHKRKVDHLLELLQKGANITCTHRLYLSMTEAHFSEMRKHDYVLIIDEELGMIEDYKKYTAPDVNSLIKLGCLEIQESDGMVLWCKDNLKEFDDVNHTYHDFKRHVDNNMVYVSKRNHNMFVSQLPVKLITVAKRVIVLTYMFEGNILSSFLSLKGLTYKKFDEVTLRDVKKDKLRGLINIYNPKMKKWKREIPMSVSSYQTMSSENIKHISNYIMAICKEFSATDYDTMFTFPKSRSNFADNRQNKIKPKGFVDSALKARNTPEKVCWLASSTRATNAYKHKSCVIHAYDRYPNSSVESYLQDYGYPINRDVFALSEMLQWIWRSRIRDDKPINLAILSPRMKKLFLDWLYAA